MLDVQGRELRTSPNKQEDLFWKVGEEVTIRADDMRIPSTNLVIQIDCRAVMMAVKDLDEVRLGDNG